LWKQRHLDLDLLLRLPSWKQGRESESESESFCLWSSKWRTVFCAWCMVCKCTKVSIQNNPPNSRVLYVNQSINQSKSSKRKSHATARAQKKPHPSTSTTITRTGSTPRARREATRAWAAAEEQRASRASVGLRDSLHTPYLHTVYRSARKLSRKTTY